MSLNFVLDRIKNQIVASHPPKILEMVSDVIALSPPLSIERLRDILMNEIAETNVLPHKSIHFHSFYDFVEWYLPNMSQFSETQRTALHTLVETRNMVEVGCNCTRRNRENVADEYFKNFWMNNISNDMIPTLLKIAQADNVKFGNFLSYPT